MEVDAPVDDEALERGRDALARGAWEDARGCFDEAVARGPSAAAWEGLSWAAWWLEDGMGAIGAREEAYRAFKQSGDVRGAARMAIWLAMDHVEFRGAEAVAQGWFARCERILADLEPAPEHGWLAAFMAAFAFEEGDPVTARQLGTDARELGRSLRLTSLEMLGLATEGLAMVTAGEVDAGMRCLDEASAAALGGEYEEQFPICWTCCYLIYACEHVRDFDRAAQWCRKVEEYSELKRIRWVHRICRSHYAAVLTWHGEWAKAERELRDAVDELAAIRPAWVPEVNVRLADLRRRQGRLDEAQQRFADSEPLPLAVQGAGELCLDRGRPADAVPLAERLLRQLPELNRTQRAGALELIVRAHAATGDAAAARPHLEELRSIAGAVASEPLRAALRFCEGVTAHAAGDRRAARAALEDAVALFDMAAAPFEAARARLELAGCLADVGERETGVTAAAAARDALEALGAEVEAARARDVHARLARPRRGDGPLTAREAEVLRLVADGLSDRQIAERLVLSPHTVHRHVSNVYAKLGCSTRAAAVAHATRLGAL